MCQFDHQNVIKLHGVVTEAPAMIVLEYMSHGDLRNLLLKLRFYTKVYTYICMYVRMYVTVLFILFIASYMHVTV